MGTEVLRPRSCLVDRIRNSPAVFQRRRNSHRKPPSRPEHRRRFASDDEKTAMTIAAGEIGMEKVTKREKSPLEMVAENVYAGSATSVLSPAPSSLPFPSFSRKKKSQVVPIDDSATRDLRRLLRLES